MIVLGLCMETFTQEGEKRKNHALVGKWRDNKGSKYEVSHCLESPGSLSVKTTRDNGFALTTRGLIRVDECGETFDILWGKKPSFVLITASMSESFVEWRSLRDDPSVASDLDFIWQREPCVSP